MSMCVYTCIYVIHIIYNMSYTHMRICYVYMYMYTCVCTYIYIYIYICIYATTV